MGKTIRCVFKTETLALHECTDGYYLWDDVVGMNIAMYSKTEQAAFVEALMYYQRRLAEVKAEHNALTGKVESFLCQFKDQD